MPVKSVEFGNSCATCARPSGIARRVCGLWPRGRGPAGSGIATELDMARRLESAAREALLLRRQVLLGLRDEHQRGEQQLLVDREPDPVDVAAVQSGADFLERLSEAELRQLDLVHKALRRIDADEYGLCEECGEPIAARRLEAIPWAAHCVDCATAAEAQSSRQVGLR